MKERSIGYLGEELNFLVKQGCTFGPFVMTVKNPDNSPVDLSQIEIRGQFKKTISDAPGVSFFVNKTSPTMGVFEFYLTADQTEQIACGNSINDLASQYFYDFEMDSGLGQITPLIYGIIRVFRGISK